MEVLHGAGGEVHATVRGMLVRVERAESVEEAARVGMRAIATLGEMCKLGRMSRVQLRAVESVLGDALRDRLIAEGERFG